MKIALALILCCIVPACGSKKEDAPAAAAKAKAPTGAEAIAAVSGFRDRMCACKDKDCFTKVSADQDAYVAKAAGRVDMTDTESTTFDDAVAAYAVCATKLQAALK